LKILAVVGSPRKKGNTDILINEVLKGAKAAGSKFEKIFLNDLEIKPCQAECSSYCKKRGYCKIKDDMERLYDKLFESDIIILATPVYWYGPSAQLKTFIDRWYAFCHPRHVLKMKGKRFVLIAPLEELDKSAAQPLVNMIKRSLDYLDSKFHAKLIVSAGEKGEVKKDLHSMKQAYKIGLKLK